MTYKEAYNILNIENQTLESLPSEEQFAEALKVACECLREATEEEDDRK